MCFAIPYKIEKIEKELAIVEGGKKVIIGNAFKARKGDYLQVVGNMAVGKISKGEGLRIRNMIKNIYEG